MNDKPTTIIHLYFRLITPFLSMVFLSLCGYLDILDLFVLHNIPCNPKITEIDIDIKVNHFIYFKIPNMV